MMRIAIVGMGQIARTQHLPAILASDDYVLAAVVSPVAVDVPEGVPVFGDFEALLESGVRVDAVALCTPPGVRHGLARRALAAGMHVLAEKPPAQTVAEASDLAAAAKRAGKTFFATWHSRFSAAAPVAREIVGRIGVQSMRVVWCENNEKWHPNANWFWEPGGFGAFDAGINALSLVQDIMPGPVFFKDADLDIEEGRHAPVRAEVRFTTDDPAVGFMDGLFDIGLTGDDETWTITWVLHDGTTLELSQGGAVLKHDGEVLVDPEIGDLPPLDEEYRALYRRFATLVARRQSDVDARPLELVCDILAFGVRRSVRLRQE